MEVGTRRLMRETSPDRAKVCLRQRVKGIKKVQVVYYLSRNGQLEHPHFMDVTHLADQPLRLKDVMERLAMLRGKGMPSLYSWSCKRIYKNGYVWNDLGLNDTIYPAEGAEYVLKGSELVQVQACSARLQQIEINNSNMKKQETRDIKERDNYEEEFEYEIEEEKTTTSSSSRCSRGVSTDDDQSNDIVSGSGSIRNSLLLHLIACGSSVAAKAKPPGSARTNVTNNLHRGVLCKSAAKMSSDEDMIKCMSENPRFGNAQAEEKDYFSGSIVDRIGHERDVALPPVLKRSNSYNEERSEKGGLEERVDKEKREKSKTTGKCIPRKRCSASSSKTLN